MNTEPTCVELSSGSSRESLSDLKNRAAELNVQEVNWKMGSRRLSVDEEIELPGSKFANPASSASATEANSPDSPTGGVSSLARDARRLKTATLERMGKMLKLNSKSGGEKVEASPGSASCEDTTRKAKFNSLTRMLRLSDHKDEKHQAGAVGGGGGQSGGCTLTRILRKKVPAEGDNDQPKQEEQGRGIFSRIMGNLRGKHGTNAKTAENSPQKNKDDQALSKSPSSLSLTEVNLENSCQLVNAQRES